MYTSAGTRAQSSTRIFHIDSRVNIGLICILKTEAEDGRRMAKKTWQLPQWNYSSYAEALDYYYKSNTCSLGFITKALELWIITSRAIGRWFALPKHPSLDVGKGARTLSIYLADQPSAGGKSPMHATFFSLYFLAIRAPRKVICSRDPCLLNHAIEKRRSTILSRGQSAQVSSFDLFESSELLALLFLSK